MLSPVFEPPPQTPDPVLEEQSLLVVEELVVVAVGRSLESSVYPTTALSHMRLDCAMILHL